MDERTVTTSDKEAVSKGKPAIPADISTLSSSELQKLVHELYIRQEYMEAKTKEMGIFRDKYLNLYDSAPVGYLTVSKGCNILEANLTAASLLGMGRDELIGQSMYSLISEEDKDLFFELLMAVFRSQSPTTCELKLKKTDKTEFIAELRGISEKSANGQYDRFKVILSNITKRRQSEILQRKLRDNLESLWELSKTQQTDLKVLADHVLEEIKRISESRYAFYGFIDDEETEMEIYSWSREAMNQCKIVDKLEKFPIPTSGIWGDAVRKRQSIVVNDYNENHECKVGLPQGHVELTRVVSVPVFSRGKIVAVGAVANKESEYTEDDVKQLEVFLSHAQIISNQIRLQEALSKSETKFRTVADFTHDWEYWINPDGALIYVSPSCERITGYDPDEFINDPGLLVKIVHPEDLSLVGEQLKSIDSGPPLQCEFRIVSSKGETRWIGQVSQTVYNLDGAWLGRRVSNRDITKRKLAELDLRASEEKFSKVYLLNPDSMSITTLADGKFVSVNDGFERILGFKEREVIGKTSAELNLWGDTEDRQKISEALKKEGRIYNLETRVRTRNGDIRYGLMSCSIIELNGEQHILTIGRDITDKKAAEDALRASEGRWQFALEGARDGVWDYNLTTNEVFYSRQWKAMLDYEEHEIGNTLDEWVNRLHPEDKRRLKEIKDKFCATDMTSYEAEFRMLGKNGAYKWILSRGKSTEWTDDGRPSRFIGTHADITTRKLMEEALREREREWTTLINNLPGFVYRCANDRYWTMDYISHGCKEVTGYAPDDFIGNKSLSFNDIVDPNYREPLWEKWQEILAHNSVFEEEYPIITRGGETRWVWERGRGIFSDDGRLLFLEGFITDVTERKKIQEDLRESHENFRTFFESIDDVIVVGAPDGKIMHSNSALTRKLGYSREEIENMHVLDLNCRSQRQEAETIFSDMFTGHRTSCPLPLEKKDGTLLPSETRVWFGKWSGVDATFGICKDLSKEQDALQRFDRLFEFNPNPLAVNSTEDGRIVLVNEAFLSTLGFSRDEVIGMTSEELDLFTDPEAQREVATRLEVHGVIRNIELQVKKKNGDLVEGLFSGTIIVIQERKYLLTTMLDITERKQATEALKQSEKNLRSFFQTISESVFLMKPDGEILEANETFASRLGKNPEDVIGHCVFDFLEPETTIKRRGWIDEIVLSGKPVRIEDKRQNSILVHNIYPILNSEGVVDRLAIYANDVTAARLSETALRESEARFRLIVEAANEGIWSMDGKFKTTFVNRRMADMLAYSPDEMLGRTVDSFMFEEDLPDHSARMAGRLAGTNESYERRFRKKNGEEIWTLVSATALIDGKLGFQGSFAMFTDITERKRAEEALTERESYLRNLLMSMINGFVLFESVFDERGNFLSCKFIMINQSFERITGVKGEDIIGHSIHEVWPETEQEWIEAFGRVALTGTPSSFEMFHHPTRSHYYCNVYRPENSRKRFCVVFEDITDRVRVAQEKEAFQAQVLQAQKIEAIGTMAGGIAHDHNNIVQAILGYTELAMQDVAPGSPVYSSLERVLEAAKRSGNMMKQILTFSRRSTPKVTTIDVSPLVKEGLKFLQAAIPSTIEIKGRIKPGLGKILADPTQIHQVLMNLCINASQAMKNGKGKIYVELSELNVVDNCVPPHHEITPGKYLLLKVSDTGVGIPAEILDKIFDPYFTTKESGEGTGLGLSVVHGIVRSSNGVITVESTPGAGSTFNVFFPLVKEPMDVKQECETTTILPGTEHILFVDDEVSLLEMYERQLKRLGYHITAVDNPDAALEILSQHPQKFDVIVVDMIMPKMTGLELSEKIRLGWPNIPIIMCTGWMQDLSDDDLRRTGIRAVVTKPTRNNEIADAVRKVMDQSR